MKPIKRHISLQPLSHDHHDALLLCWKIRKGIKQNIEPTRIKSYTNWFYSEHLKKHFQIEEQDIFTLLPKTHLQVKEALEQHKHLNKLFTGMDNSTDHLHHIANELEKHIRFEERLLFNTIQQAATEEELKKLNLSTEEEQSCSKWTDEFWNQSK